MNDFAHLHNKKTLDRYNKQFADSAKTLSIRVVGKQAAEFLSQVPAVTQKYENLKVEVLEGVYPADVVIVLLSPNIPVDTALVSAAGGVAGAEIVVGFLGTDTRKTQLVKGEKPNFISHPLDVRYEELCEADATPASWGGNTGVVFTNVSEEAVASLLISVYTHLV